MTLSEELKWRGLIQETTLEDISQLDGTDWKFYIGFDASAPSQTIGNLAAMMAAKTFLRHGHHGIILAGGATSLIGDAGGRDKEREIQAKEVIADNIEKAVEQFKLVFKGYQDQLTYLNNLDWFADFKVLDFLRDVGKHFSMTPLIQRDYIASRLGAEGSGISYAEFSYTLLQGYDYLKLFQDFGCNLQLGGSDQWGNCLSGVDLIRRKHQASVHVASIPLIINKTTKRKFGKSESGAIWLDPDLTHPSDFYQFWLNSDDLGVIDYLKIFTDLDHQTIQAIADQQQADPKSRLAQTRLADEVTKAIHGQEVLSVCQVLAKLAFKPDKLTDGIGTLLGQFKDKYRIKLPLQADLQVDIEALLDELLGKGLIASKTAGRELIQSNALKVVATTGQQFNLKDNRPIGQNGKLAAIIIGKNKLRLLET